MSLTPSDPHGPDAADGTPSVCPRHPGRAAFVGCPTCGRPMCLDCQRPVAGGRVVCADCDACAADGSPRALPGAGTAAAPRAGRGGVLASLAAAPVTSALLAVTALVYVLQWMTRASSPGVTEALWYAGAYTSTLGMEPWRMLTYALVHDVSGPTHVALNLLALWMIGRGLEPVLGWWRHLALYAVSAVGGAVFALWTSDPLQPVVGASGAVYGLFAALFLLARRVGGQVRSIAVLIGLNLAVSFLLPGISWQVHVGSLLTGAAVALLFTRVGALPGSGRGSRTAAGAHGAGLVLILAVLAAFTLLGAQRIGMGELIG